MKQAEKTFIIIGFLILMQSCLVSRTQRPKLTGYVFDAATNKPIERCKVGDSFTNSKGFFELKELRYLQFTFIGMEAPPVYVNEIVEKEGYEKDTIEFFNLYGGGQRRGAHWDADTILLKKDKQHK